MSPIESATASRENHHSIRSRRDAIGRRTSALSLGPRRARIDHLHTARGILRRAVPRGNFSDRHRGRKTEATDRLPVHTSARRKATSLLVGPKSFLRSRRDLAVDGTGSFTGLPKRPFYGTTLFGGEGRHQPVLSLSSRGTEDLDRLERGALR